MAHNQKDHERFLEEYSRHADAIFRYCLLRVGKREEAYDVTQETFFRAWRYIADGKNVESFRPFFYKTAKNVIIDFFRRKKLISLEYILQEGGGALLEHDALSLNGEDAIIAREAIDFINHLEKTYKDPVILRYVEGMSVQEIAETLNESENVISVRIHRGIKKIKEKYQ